MKFCIKNKKPSVVLIENDPMFSIQFSIELRENSNCVLHNFYNAEEALNEIKLIRPALVVIGTQKEKGLTEQQILIAVKTILPDALVVILSSSDDVEKTLDLLKSGADNIISKKAYTESHLMEHIYSLFESKHICAL